MSLAVIERLEPSCVWSYDAVFHATPAAMALAHRRHGALRIGSANDAFLEIFHCRREAVEGGPLSQLFRAAAAERVRQAAEQCLGAGEPVRLRITHSPAGALPTLELEFRRLSCDAEPRLLISVTQVRQPLALASLGEADVLAEIGALSGGLVYIHDIRRRVFRFGRDPLADRLGLQGAQISVADAIGLVHPDDQAHARRQVNDPLSAADGEIRQWACRMRAHDGAWLWININARVFARAPSGEVRRIIGVATDETEHYEHAAAIARAASALAHAELDERRRIGRELHDSTAQLLVAAQLGLAALSQRSSLSDESLSLLEEVRHAVGDAQHEIRTFSYMLHPPSLEAAGLPEMLRRFAEGFARRTGLSISWQIPRGAWRLPFATEVALFRVAQEALMNVYRHAHAQRVVIRLVRRRRDIVLEVQDDGIGLASCDTTDALAGVGVSGMRARMNQLGGALDLLSSGTGLTVRATAPRGGVAPQVYAGLQEAIV